MSIDLKFDNYRLVRAAWTAMDQTYSPLLSGYRLQPVDNSGQGRLQPFAVPEGFTVVKAPQDSATGLQVGVYSNPVTKEILISPMGTNGWGALDQWHDNVFETMGKNAWEAVKLEVYQTLNATLIENNGGTLIWAGDSRGGAIVQWALLDLATSLKDDASRAAFAATYPNLANLSIANDMAAVLHSSPGVSWLAQSQFDALSTEMQQQLRQMPTDITIARSGKVIESVSKVGGSYLVGDGSGIKLIDAGDGINDAMHLHRMASSGWAWAQLVNGDFDQRTSGAQEILPLEAAQAIGTALANIGNDTSLNTDPEIVTRMGIGLLDAWTISAPGTAFTLVREGTQAILGETGSALIGVAAELMKWAKLPYELALTTVANIVGLPLAKIFEQAATPINSLPTEDTLGAMISAAGAPALPEYTNRYAGRDAYGNTVVYDFGFDGVSQYTYTGQMRTSSTVFQDGHYELRSNGMTYLRDSDGMGMIMVDLNGQQRVISVDANTAVSLRTGNDGQPFFNLESTVGDVTAKSTVQATGQWNSFVTQDSQAVQTTGNLFANGTGDLSATYQIQNDNGRYTVQQTSASSISRSSLTPAGQVVMTVERVVNGQTVKLEFIEDEWGDLQATRVLSINGQPPASQTLAQELARQGYDGFDFANGDTLPDGKSLSQAVSSLNPARVGGLDTLYTALATTADALSLLRALQTGEPLPILASGLRLADSIPSISNAAAEAGFSLSGTAAAVSGVLSLMSLDQALKQGDTLGAITAGANAIHFASQAFTNFAADSAMTATTFEAATTSQLAYNGAVELQQSLAPISKALPYLNIVNSLAHGDVVGAAVYTISLSFPPLGIAYTVFNLISSLFGDDDPPTPWGSGHWRFNAQGQLERQVSGESGGDAAVSGVMNDFQSMLEQIIATQAAANPNIRLGLIPQRMPGLDWNAQTYGVTDIDPATGAARFPEVRYQPGVDGRPIGGETGSDQASWPLMERLLRSAVGRGAIAPDWEVQTAYLQGLNNLGMAGLTEEERAGRQSRLLAAPGQDGPADTPYSFRPVVLDLDGDGLSPVTRSQSGVGWNVDDSGYLKKTGWIQAEGAQTDAFLTLDRDLNGQIDGGRELFSNGQVEAGLRGVASLEWLDANGDGQITAADPVWQSLGLWQDQNGDGKQDEGETLTLAGQGITALDYRMGRYTLTTDQGQVTRQLGSPALEADRVGSISIERDEGLVVVSSTGQVTLFASKVDDQSVLSPGQDGVIGIEDTELLIAPADLLANDTLGGLTGHGLSITGVGNATHGAVSLDGNGMVRFMPEANYFGVAGFTYSLAAPTGQTAAASVVVNLENVNDAPIVFNGQAALAIYGYENYHFTNGGNWWSESLFVEPLSPRFESYYGYNYAELRGLNSNLGDYYPNRTDNVSPIEIVNSYGQRGQMQVSDPDNQQGVFTYQVISQPQYGAANIDANGNWTYANWTQPNIVGYSGTPVGSGEYSYGYTYGYQTDGFRVRITDELGASTDQNVSVTHIGNYTIPSSGGGDGGCFSPIALDLDGDGIQFSPVDMSDTFFDLNADGWKRRVSWPEAGDGWLALDINGNGQVDDGNEIAFTRHVANAQSDLEGLALAFDSNGDGVLSNLDARWSDFGIWQDADQDGVTDAGEFRSLDDWGITQIGLTSDGVFEVVNGNTVLGSTQAQRADGGTMDVADVVLQYRDEVRIDHADGSYSTVQLNTRAADHLVGGDGNDLIPGQGGNNWIEAGAGDDVVMDDAGDDMVDGGAGNDVLYTGQGNDLILTGEGDNTVFAGAGDDIVLGGGGHDALVLEAGNDLAYAGAGNDFVSGGEGNDLITGNAGDDRLYGEAGQDALFGNEGEDELVGGLGDDQLDGGAGSDNYTLARGDGHDTLTDTGPASDTDVLHIDGSLDQLTFTRTATQLTVSFKDGSASVTYGRHLGDQGTTHDLEFIELADGTLLTPQELDQLSNGAPTVRQAQLANQSVEAERAFTLTLAFGEAVVDTDGDALTTQVRLANGDPLPAGWTYDPATRTLTGMARRGHIDSGLDLSVEFSDPYGLTARTALHLEVTPPQGLLVDGTSRAETLRGGAGDDLITGAGGPDTLYGLEGEDLFLVNGDSGGDRVNGGEGLDEVRGGDGDDILRLSNFYGEDTVERIDGGRGVNKIATHGWSTRLDFSGTELVNIARIEGGDGPDTLIGSQGSDVIQGGKGPDTLRGEAGNDLFLVDGDSGNDAVSGGDGIDELRGGDGDDIIRLAQYSGVNTVERIDGGAGFNRIATGAWAAKLDFSATELLNIARIEGGDGNETLIGSQGDDVISGGKGPDVLRGEGGNDVFLVEGDSGSDMVSGGEGFDELRGSAGDDILRLSNYYGDDTVERIDGGAGVNRIVGGAWAARLDFSGTELVNIHRIEGSAGNNVIIGSNGNDVLAGMGGPDQISGGQGNDVYQFNRGDGVDTWIENDATAGNQDIARFGLDVLYDQIWFQKKGNNLEAQIIGTTDKAIIKDWYLGGARQIERFETVDGHALLNNQLDQLVQAMAAFNPPPAGQSSLPDNYRQALEPVLAASWG